MDRKLYPTIVNERDDPEYNDSFPETDPYHPYFDDARRALYRDLQILNSELRNVETAISAMLHKLEASIEEESRHNRQHGAWHSGHAVYWLRDIEESLILICERMDDAQTDDNHHSISSQLDYLKQIRRLSHDQLHNLHDWNRGLAITMWGMGNLCGGTLRYIDGDRCKLQSQTMSCQAWIEELKAVYDMVRESGSPIFSLTDRMRDGLAAAMAWEQGAEERAQARKEWEETQLMKLWPVS